jgi:hypothetical protein
VTDLARTIRVNAFRNVLEHINAALPSIDVHLAEFPTPLDKTRLRHARVVITLCASPAFIVGLRCTFSYVHSHRRSHFRSAGSPKRCFVGWSTG